MKSGSRDINGNWVDETPQAKLRNQLSPFWTLTTILSEHKDMLNTEEGVELIMSLVKQCELSKEVIINLINETEK